MSGAIQTGAYVRTPEGIGYIFRKDGDKFQVVSMERDEERDYPAGEMTRWSPSPGDRVIEADTEGGIAGDIVSASGCASLVKWDGFIDPQTWANASLEPYCHN
ncbi:hypothetical protein [Bradyrhizobium erythrophlei]|uniref:hypothetical protein n=1 Tax=Bradyrhizobium erythrophlei TaxID=1437360 RepID=UPI0012AB3FB7|nr:hypothetical protein [Bradyrhizobium erythrophlei]